MKKSVGRWMVIGWLLAPAMILGWAGCESEDSPDTESVDDYFDSHPYVSDPRAPGAKRDVSVSPAEASVTFVGQEIAFYASGGQSPYTWDVADPSAGRMHTSATRAQDARYECLKLKPNSVIVADNQGHAAIATINSSTGSPPAALTAAANPTSLSADGQKAQLSATGGSPPYTWTVDDAFLGGVSPSVGSSVVYTRNHVGDNSVTVTDNAGNSAGLVIQQP